MVRVLRPANPHFEPSITVRAAYPEGKAAPLSSSDKVELCAQGIRRVVAGPGFGRLALHAAGGVPQSFIVVTTGNREVPFSVS